MITKNTIVVGLVSGSNLKYEKAVLNEMEELGGKVVSVGEKDADIVFDSAVPEHIQGVLYLPVLQLMAFYRSLAKGYNPDRPKNLEAVVKINL